MTDHTTIPDDEYPLICDSCGRNLPCRHCPTVPDEAVEAAAKAVWSVMFYEAEKRPDDYEAVAPTYRDAARVALAAALPLLTDAARAPDTRTLSQESRDYIGTSIQNAAHGVGLPIPEVYAEAITENLIASTWLTDRLNEAEIDAARAEVEREHNEWVNDLDALLGINDDEPGMRGDGDEAHEWFIEEWIKYRMRQADEARGQVASVLALAEKGERDGRGNSLELARALRAAVSADGVAAFEARIKAQALREAADEWLRGEWANAPRDRDRIRERIANGNWTGQWLNDRADAIEGRA